MEDITNVHRVEGIIDIHWWSVEEIEITTEPVYPTDLGDRIQQLVSKMSQP